MSHTASPQRGGCPAARPPSFRGRFSCPLSLLFAGIVMALGGLLAGLIGLGSGPKPVQAAPSPQGGQVDFQRWRQGGTVSFRYDLRAPDGQGYRLSFQVPAAHIDQQRRAFQAHNPQELKKLAQQEFKRQMAGEVERLRREFPQATLSLGSDGSISWQVGSSDDFMDRQQALYQQFYEREIEALRRDFPQAKITRQGNGFAIEAPSQKMVNAISTRFKQAERKAKQAVTQLRNQERKRIDKDVGRIQRDLQRQIQAVEKKVLAFREDYYNQRFYKLYDKRLVRPDYAAIAHHAEPALKPVAAMLRQWTNGLDQRESLERLLLFTQTIPYDRLEDRATDAGFLMPLVLLAENRGDCDTKAVAFAALLHRLEPKIRSALVLVPNHALLALAIAPRRGDRTLRHAGRTWVLVEPVGPAIRPPGSISEQSERGLRRVEGIVPLFPQS